MELNAADAKARNAGKSDRNPEIDDIVSDITGIKDSSSASHGVKSTPDSDDDPDDAGTPPEFTHSDKE